MEKLITKSFKRLLDKGIHRGFITYEELRKSLGKRHFNQQNVENAFLHIFDNKICLVKKKIDYNLSRKRDTPSPDSQKSKDVEKSDDPIRMYLREMGGVELLSREGEIAIAKRIEAGKNVMTNGLFQSPITAKKVFDWKEKLEKNELLVREIIDIDSTYIESEDEDLADDLTIEETDLGSFEAWDAPPPPEGPRVKFIPYDDPPKPLTPIRPKYPEIAQEAGIEGTVIVQVFVDKKGRVKETIILKGIPNTGLDEAAIAAIRKTRFLPAKQRERAVGVWISIPVNFRLK